MNRMAYLVILTFSLTLIAACSNDRQAATAPTAKALAPTAASLSTATPVPLSTATAVPISTATPVPRLTASATPRPALAVAPISTSTPVAVSPAGPAKPGAPTAAGVAIQGSDWKLYRDESDGIEFSYPTACSVTQHDGSLTVGGRIDLAFTETGGLALRDYVARFIDERTRTSGWKVDSQQTVTLGTNKGVRVDYRFGGTNRFGSAVFIEGRGRVYTWGLTAGSFTCNEPAAFDGIVSSFRSTR